MEEKQKKVLAKRIQLVDVVLEGKGLQLFEGRRVRSLEDAANMKNGPTALQVVHTGLINASIVHLRDVLKSAILSNSASIVVTQNLLLNVLGTRNFNL